jgi:CheY-like chemotaxis protein
MAKRIAVVNDDTAFLGLMCELLGDEGYEAYTIREAGNAYEQIKKTEPDAIVLDIRIEHPEGGWTVLELLKLDPALTHIPVIVCSADSRALEAGEERLEQHGCRVLPKPFNLDELLSLLLELTAQPAE